MAPENACGEEPQHRKPQLTRKTLFVLGAMNLIDCINVNLLTPYVDKMVSTLLQQSPQSPAVAHTVGMLIGLYSLCEVVFSPFWGTLADKVGRKPALLVGLGGSVIAPIMFGLGTTLPTIFAARALDGFFCGNMGVTRTYLGEIVDESNEAKGFSFLALCFSVGLFVGPILGGELVFPAERAPQIFGGTIFEEYPFLLPNLTYAIFAAIAWVIGCVFLEETLPHSKRCCHRRTADLPEPTGLTRSTSGTDPSGAPNRYVIPEDESQASDASNKKGCYSLEMVSTIVTYCALSGTTAAQNQLLILLVSYEKSAGGFEFGPRDIGFLQNIGAVGLLSSQLFLYPKLTKKFGFLKVFLFGFFMAHLSYGLFPIYGAFADPDKYGIYRFIPLGMMQFVYTAATGMMFPTAFAFINRSAEGFNRGAVNGWANSSGALCRAAFPPASAVMLTMSASWGPMGRYFPLYIVTMIAAVCIACSMPGLRLVNQKSVVGGPSGPARAVPVRSAEEDCQAARREPLMEA
ncbi:unnamed protein product [Durusdinium trenchii]|uniref:Major facilitator superfamily (MFS) profile domain-containing protein n=2 Tax=Durusdinium trenchii TaxID=1381693 RepID=A0ABP0NTA0_9DINO